MNKVIEHPSIQSIEQDCPMHGIEPDCPDSLLLHKLLSVSIGSRCKNCNQVVKELDIELIKDFIIYPRLLLKDSRGRLPIHVALINKVNNLELIKLLAIPETLELLDNDWCTPLHLAVLNKRVNIEIVKLLITQAALIKQTKLNAFTPLLIAVANHVPANIVKLLVTPETLLIKGSLGRTPAHLIASMEFKEMDTKLFDLILTKETLVSTDINGCTPFHNLIYNNRCEEPRLYYDFIIEDFVNPDVLKIRSSNTNDTPYEYTKTHKNKYIEKFILKYEDKIKREYYDNLFKRY